MPALVVAKALTMQDDAEDIIADAVARLPQWVRQDLLAKDAALRTRAEETLTAIIAGALSARTEQNR